MKAQEKNKLPGPGKLIGYLAVLLIGGYALSKAAADKHDPRQEAAGDLKDLANKGIIPTIGDAQALGIANSIYAAWSAVPGMNDEETVVNKLGLIPQNEADVLKIVKAYGKRKKPSFVFSVEQDLQAAVNSGLSIENVARINQCFQDKKMNFRI